MIQIISNLVKTSACKERPHQGCCSTLQSKLHWHTQLGRMEQIVAEQTAGEQIVAEQTAEEQIAAGQIAAAEQEQQTAEGQRELQIVEGQRWA